MTTLNVQNLSLTIDRSKILNGVSLSLKGGELVGLIGPNGAGKSSLLRCVTGGVRQWTGNIALDGQQVNSLPRVDRARHLSYMPQRTESLWPITGRRLVMLGRLPHLGAFSMPTDKDHMAVDSALQQVDAAAFADRPVTQLSGGELGRIWLARALAVEAPLLLADEPIAALDPAHQLATMESFKAATQNGHGILTVLHDLALAARYCDRLILMNKGQVIAEGKPDQVLTPDRVADIYHVRLEKDGAGNISLLPL